ncbi:MAG: GxxExxY protein [Candidatus Stygibacter australis]|nr:GxxExxY protein [Candidatus Stygibacter australis]
MSEYIYQKEIYKIRGAIYEVYKEIGCGFLEAVYQECLSKEFLLSKIPFVAQQNIVIDYKGENLVQFYCADFVCYDKIILEIKAIKSLEDIHLAQIMNYLKATGFKLGFLVNFYSYPKVEIKRIVL